MKTTNQILRFFVAAFFMLSANVYAQPSARVQIIHNSADAAATVVDVWANNDKLIENFQFRTATPFVDVPAKTPITISITGPGSTRPDENVFQADVTFDDGGKYVVVAGGIVSPGGYSPDFPFGLSVYPLARESASSSSTSDLLVFHGSTDAPDVSVWETGVGAGELFAFSYGQFRGYLELPVNDYVLELRDKTGSKTLAAYQAPLATLGLEGKSLTVLASGFMYPDQNSNGPGFGLFAALATGGELIELPTYRKPTARLQVIHNAADEALQVIDVWADGQRVKENFSFRTSTEFTDVAANRPITVSVSEPGRTEPLASAEVMLEEGKTYIAVAGGMISPRGYTPLQPFNIYIYESARESASDNGNTDVLAFHGSTDAPTVSVWETGVGAGELFTFSYGDFAGYLELPADDYVLEIRNESGTASVASYAAPLASLGLQGQAISVIASGFLNPDINSDGPSFGLYVSLASGGELIPLPVVSSDPMARLQVIHNSADAAAEVVDVWAGDTKLIENFEFRTATEFIDVPADAPITLSITGPNSTGPQPNVFQADVTFSDGGTYVVVANGIVSANGYEPNIPFNLYINDLGREEATMATNTDVLVFHGSTDAPTVSVWETGIGAGELFTFSYGDYAGYLELPTEDYILEVRDETGTVTVAAYQAPLSTLDLDGAAISVIASGFLNPDANSDGPAFGLWVALASGGDLVELPLVTDPMARLQVIHNSADAAAEVVDVWAGDTKLIENFEFRTATEFIDVPADTPITLSITGPNSTGPQPNVFQADVTFADGGTYVVVANGIVSPAGYEPNIPFNLYIYDLGREEATMATNTDVLVFHGSTDAPTVSIWETGVGAGELFTFSYGEYAGYLELSTEDYILEVRDETGTVTVAAYQAPLSTLGLNGDAITVVASGFLNPDVNSDGPAFGLWVALASGGDLVELPLVPDPMARLQVIHNSADAAAEVVDVWAGDTKLIENFEFRTATEFIDVPADAPITLSITGPNSSGPQPNVFQADVTFADGGTYVVVANGIVSPAGYDPNIPFNLYIYDMGREEATMATNTDVLVFHGSTDAPTVSIWETGVGAGELFTFSYGEYAGYLELPTDNYVLEVRDETGTVTVAAYAAPLANLGLDGEAISIVASGFLNPDVNSNGPEFGLWVALASGGELIELPLYTGPMARLQVIHNSADAAAGVVDVWANDVKLIENFEFRTATPFIDVEAETPITLSITGPNSSSPSPNVFEADVTFSDFGTYVVVANGIVSGSGYDPIEPFNLYIYDMGREAATSSMNTDLLVYHGSTDAPVVSVWETGVGAGELFTFAYGEFAGYLELPTTDYILEIRDESGTTTVAMFHAPLGELGLDGEAITVVASGFLNPGVNSNGPAFGLWVALTSGGDLIELPSTTTGIESITSSGTVAVFPNSARDFVTLNMTLNKPANVNVQVVDLLGKTVNAVDLGWQSTINNYRIDVSNIPRGLYLLRVEAGIENYIEKLVISR